MLAVYESSGCEGKGAHGELVGISRFIRRCSQTLWGPRSTSSSLDSLGWLAARRTVALRVGALSLGRSRGRGVRVDEASECVDDDVVD